MKKTLFCILFLGFAFTATAQEDKDHNFTVAKNLDVLNVIYKHLDLMYVDSLNGNEVIGNGINAMLQSLDPYTVYYPEEKVKELKFMITGKYGGIGSVIRYNNQLKRVIIDQPYEHMPAAEVGLKKGDIILSIDDKDMTHKDQEYVSNHLRGDPGTSFILKIKRPSTGKVMKMKITRRAIQTPAVPYYGMKDNGVGYINLSSFTENCSKDVRRAFMDLKQKGMKSLIFDLRGNGGGSESEAVNIVNMFVPKGVLVVSNRGKLKRVNRDYKTTVEPIDTVMPIVVLVDESSASASEITCGALQDLDRAVIMGMRTYGKGLVQMTLDLPYNGTLKLTTSKYYIPSGRCIQAINYKHSNGGYTEHVPDSLTKVFYTSRGREVRDGGGIMPDVEVKADSVPNIAYYLAGVRDSNELLLNYQLDYIASHPVIAQPEQFDITDAEYEDFKQRVLKADFKYDRESEKYLKTLVKLAKFEGYYDEAKTEFDNLEKKLSHNVAKDLDFNKETIKKLIANGIIPAYYYQKGNIQYALSSDKQIKEAMALLADGKRYKTLLQPKKK
ncbi:MAG: S41 family peptidase [Hoylesella saccharolytica]|jgi:peptidase, S41 family|uniref:S41 family peptidase n=1 Tax=Hoylesella saccharolytica TaxID=633701 RepID=UPI0028D2F844|nr:S41 family peptidase [Hoylesella saccharolytica]